MKPILTFFFLVVFSALHAQDTLSRYWVVKCGIAPSPDILNNYLSVNTAVQKISDRHAYQVQLNILPPYSYMLKDTVNNQIAVDGKCWGFSLRADFRKFRSLNNRNHSNKHVYWGAELFYTRYNTARLEVHANLRDTTFLRSNNIGYKDAFLLKKSVLGSSLIAGIQRRIGKRFFIDCNFGIGIKFKNITSGYKLSDEDENSYRHAEFTNLADKTGFSVALALPVNFSLGYCL